MFGKASSMVLGSAAGADASGKRFSGALSWADARPAMLTRANPATLDFRNFPTISTPFSTGPFRPYNSELDEFVQFFS